ncbi:Vps53-like vacuolar protein sorting-associated protein [Chloropicon primus]|uniref:Vps53-like vacuolar protein sorting-associated protein n=2 Tax=Chloropicon primus TaxID=1764295 RepID=A0A5B8MED1_9CHLO|nr:Vps53-like vacuolar protein sorting-associated protein [Chloropicon primus]UPQ98000.1 Vps53-like vacuolar protein sorting-associated protein [Chloropicon primus]|eukprot:QDZ18793.1 Vps53-like vacuolar protein sorting-associated protein [Chloropicon primus]
MEASRMEESTSGSNGAALGKEAEDLDHIETKNFSATEYLNKLFPNEESLSGLPEFLVKLRRRIRKVNDEILVAVRQQSQTGSRAKEDLAQAQNGIEDLSGRITEIKVKAEQSETKVQEICRDIKKLDYAKRHLTNTITAFRRLSMLMSAIQNLQEVSDKRDYRETANLMEAVNQLASHFESFSQIPKVCELRGQLSAIKSGLRATIFDDFIYATAKEEIPPETLEKLTHACRVVEAIDLHVKDELVSRICNKEMSAYQQIFSTNEAPSTKLEKTDRRYTWMKKLLTRKQPFWDVFPKSWEVSSLLCTSFCKITKAHLSETLDSMRDNPDVANLLKALHWTLDFEKELNLMAGGGEISLYEVVDDGNEDGENEAADEAELTEAEIIKRKYMAARKEREEGGSGQSEPGASQAQKEGAFTGSISSCFEQHLKCYVELEEKSLMETIDNLVNAETWEAEGGENNVISSSVQVFLHIKKSLKRCSLLTKGETLFNLSSSFKRVLQAYSERLISRLPRNTSNKSMNSMATTVSSDWHVKFDDKEEKVVCLIINTAEYCYETVDSLGQSIAKILDKPFSNQIDMSEVEDDYSGVITTALSTLVLGLETRVDQALADMARVNWAALDLVGDQSEYVNVFSSVLADSIPRLGALLDQNNFRFMCDKFTASFIPRYRSTIFKLKMLSDSGTQQLLLDAQAIRTLLLDLPSLGNHGLPPSYSRTVQQEMSKAENLLKVLLSPPDAILSNFLALMPITAAKEMPQILELKGLSKAEQQDVLNEMSRRGLLDEQDTSRLVASGEGSRRMPDIKWGGKFENLKQKMKDSAKGSQALKLKERFQLKGKFNVNLNLGNRN